MAGGCDVALTERRGTPGNVSNPVSVPWQNAHVVVRLRLVIVVPKLDKIVRASRDKAAYRRGLRARSLGACELAWGKTWAPGNRIHSLAVGRECLMGERIVSKGDDRDRSIGRSSRQMASRLCGGECYDVDGRGVQRDVVYPLPLAILLSPDEDFTVV